MTHLGTRCLSFLLAMTLLFSGTLCAAASETEFPEETTAETLPQETTEESLPEETTSETLLAETTEETQPETLPTEPEPPAETEPAAVSLPEDTAPGPGLYFGQLHAHTSLSGGYGTVEEAFQFAANVDGLDFFAVTDHSNAFDNALSGSIGADGAAISAHWAAGKAAASAVTSNRFVGIFGYEMSWPSMIQLGHIGTFATPGFQSWEQPAYSSADSGLQNYYAALTSVPGAIGQFCHPGTQYGTFTDFDHYSESIDSVMTLMELFCGETAQYETAYDSYIRALDKGWHIAPTASQANFLGNWGTANSLRTVVYADTLTEEGIYDALRNYRAYATEDPDLKIFYYLDEHFMGAQLKKWRIGETADIRVSLSDPTDSAIGLVEIITDGGVVAASQMVAVSSGSVTFSLSPEYHYYFVKVTQPDGQTAITAPVWVDHRESLGISGFVCETDVPVQHQDTTLSLTLYNRENADFSVDQIQIFADDVLLTEDTSLTRIPANSTIDHHLTIHCGSIGKTRITALVSGSLEGVPRRYEAALDLSFRRSDQVTDIVIVASHGNTGLQRLSALKELAAKENIRITLCNSGITAQMLEKTRLLVVTAPNVPFSKEFLSTVSEFASYGGSILVCGQADRLDEDIHSAAELNRLLEAVGSSLRLHDDQALDDVNNGGQNDLLFSACINMASGWCSGISEQHYRQEAGCTVDAGSGTWLVRADETIRSSDSDGDGCPGGSAPTLMAWEALGAGGAVFAAGSFPFDDEALAQPKNIFDPPYANRTLLENLMQIGGETLPITTIADARKEENGTLLRIRGYVTAGTAYPQNTFPETLYVQDETGGIAVMPFNQSGIAVGTPVEIVGTLQTGGKNPVLKYVSHEKLDAFSHRYVGKTGSWDTLLDPALHGGQLVQVEGKCKDVLLRPDGTLMRCTLEDGKGNAIQILVEDGIGSLATGENTLHKTIKKGRKVRALGILYVDAEKIPVIRVRNCEEVVYVPPRASVTPDTGDAIGIPLFLMGICLTGLLLPKRKRP